MCRETSFFLSHRFTQMKHRLRGTSQGADAADAPQSICVDLCSSLANPIRLNLDRAFENELGWAGQRHIFKLHSCFLKPHLKFISTSHKDSDRPIDAFRRGKDEGARDHASAACEGFIFHAALISADRNFIRSALFNKIHVRALW